MTDGDDGLESIILRLILHIGILADCDIVHSCDI